MKKKLIGFLKDEEGIETIEYALIAALIAIATIAAARLLGTGMSTVYNDVSSGIQGTSS